MQKNINEIIRESSKFDQTNKGLIKKEGVVFTDKETCDIIIRRLNPNITDIICEPSVGKGAFVFSLIEYFRNKNKSLDELVHFTENNLFCFDINIIFINEFKLLLNSYFFLLGYEKELNLNNIKCDDFLLQNQYYDLVIGNPPYVRIQNLDSNYINILKEELKSMSLGNVDLYYAFLEKALIYSKRVGFIIPNSFIKTKSGKNLRNIIKDKVSYIYDFGNNKVWDNISTYTCIVICESVKSEFVIYETYNFNVSKNKAELSENIWIFKDNADDENVKPLSELIHHCGGGIATLRDNVYKIDNWDDTYCYKGVYKIEKDICKKVLKATTDRCFQDYKYIIYPYDKDNVIISEEMMQERYPLAFIYLKDMKEQLINRDKGKIEKYDTWYAYGRRQGLIKSKIGKCIILPLTFLKSRNIHIIEIPSEESCLVLSGIIVDVKIDLYDKFIKEISSDRFYNYCELNNKILPDKNRKDDLWLGVTTMTIKNYKY